MARKRLSLFIYQHVLEEMRAGTSARAIEDKGLASRNTVRKIRDKVEALGWLDPTNPMPTAETILELFPAPVMPVRESQLEPYRDQVKQWAEAGHTPKQIFRQLKRTHATNVNAYEFSRVLSKDNFPRKDARKRYS